MRARRPLLLAAQILLTGAVTWFLFRALGVGWEEVRSLDPETWRPGWGLLLSSTLLLGAGYWVSGALWGRMATELGGPPLPPTRAVAIFMAANLGRYVPGKVWQLLGLALLAQRASVPPAVATAAAVLGQLTALVGAAVVGGFTLLGSPDSPWAWVGGLAGAAGLALVVLPGLLRGLAERIARRAGSEAPPLPGVDGAFGIRWVLLYGLNWGIYAFSFWLLARSFDLPGSPVAVGSAFAAAYVLGYLAVFAPAGLGVREATLVAFLTPVVGSGAVGLALVARLWTTGVEVVTAIMFGSSQLLEVRRGRVEDDGE